MFECLKIGFYDNFFNRPLRLSLIVCCVVCAMCELQLNEKFGTLAFVETEVETENWCVNSEMK